MGSETGAVYRYGFREIIKLTLHRPQGPLGFLLFFMAGQPADHRITGTPGEYHGSEAKTYRGA